MDESERYAYEPGAKLPGTPYQIERRLGAGGMGVVYAVRHTFLNRREALKTIHPELVDRDDIAKRMMHEAEVLSSLRHPNIVQVTGGGIIEDRWRLPYFAMEMLNGKTLRQLIRRSALTNVESVYGIAYEMLDALAEAHAAGIVHRDVKPENIFLHNNANRTSGPRVSTKLLDFGIMAVLGGRQSRQFRGTFKYASPEQLRGEAVSPQTDLYGAALVIYEMLAGRGPFDDLRDWRELSKAHLQKDAPLLSSFVPVPPSIDRLIASALAKHPKRRPESALAFAQQLYVLKELAENRPLAAVAANTEETLLTAIFPTDGKRASSSEAPVLPKTKLSPVANAADTMHPSDKTVEQRFFAERFGDTLENADPPPGMPEGPQPLAIAFEKTDVDRAAITGTLDSWPRVSPQHGTEPIRSDESFELPGTPETSARPSVPSSPSIESSNVTPAPLLRQPAASTPALDPVPARLPSVHSRAVRTVLGIAAAFSLAMAMASIARRSHSSPQPTPPSSSVATMTAAEVSAPLEPSATASSTSQARDSASAVSADAPATSTLPSRVPAAPARPRRQLRSPKDPAPSDSTVARGVSREPSRPPPTIDLLRPPIQTSQAPAGPSVVPDLPASELKQTFRP